MIGAKFDGDDGERIIIEGEKWVVEQHPAVIFVRTVPDSKDWTKWDAFCMATMKPDPYALNGALPKPSRMVVYKKGKTEVIDGKIVVHAGGIQEAWNNRFELENPRFIGDVSKMRANSSTTTTGK